MAAADPLQETFTSTVPPASKSEHLIAGIITTVYGLDELTDVKDVSCLWLLHPRNSSRARMDPIAFNVIHDWNSLRSRIKSRKGLICVSFDQRNHGTRLIDDNANQAWRNGNPRHAQDMFSVYHGTAMDTSLLINYLPAYIFPKDEHSITSHMVLGVSLGGHAAWHCLLHDHRIDTGVVVVGCPDYARVMSDRAKKSKLETWHSSDPPGSRFLGSKDFPKALVEAVGRWDPAGLFMSQTVEEVENDDGRALSEREKQKLFPLMQKHLAGKKLFNLAGSADKLVPYACSVPFLNWLKKAIAPGGWFEDHGVQLKDKVYEGVGHEMTPVMMNDATNYILQNLAGIDAGNSKI